MISPIKTCNRCVMDTTDKKISFNQDGLCDYCQNFDKRIKSKIKNYNKSSNKLSILSNKIREMVKYEIIKKRLTYLLAFFVFKY